MNRSAQSYTDLLYEVVQTADRPLTFQEIVDRIQARRPITTQNPKATVRGAISSARQITSLGDGHYGYLPYLEHGSFLRLPLTEKRPANSRLAYPEDVRLALWPSFFENRKRKNTDPIRATLPDGTETWLPLGSAGNGAWGCTIPEPLRQFMIKRHSAAGDALLIRVMGGTTISCEIDIESQRQRDKQAMANRNRELADAVVLIFHERGVAELVGWDLIPLLLARGAYRGDTAPDPFEVALGSDDRFVNGGIAWWLAERMTPSDRAEAKARAQMHDWLFSGGLTGGLTEPPSLTDSPDAASYPERDEDLVMPGTLSLASPAAGPRSQMERTMADIGAFLEQQQPASIEEGHALLNDVLSRGALPRRVATTPLEKAQDLMYEAMDAETPEERIRLARRALKLSPDCADAYLLLADETANNPSEAIALFEQAVAACRRAIGEEPFAELSGEFWCFLETRPYMRARHELAVALWEDSQHDAAIKHFQEMLVLNPGDNQGVRYLLVPWLFATGDDAALEILFGKYPDDSSAIWVYGRALLAYRQEGDTPPSRVMLSEAIRSNRHVPAYVTARKMPPPTLPAFIGIGDDAEAVHYTATHFGVWQDTPGAVAWLASVAGPPTPPRPARITPIRQAQRRRKHKKR